MAFRNDWQLSNSFRQPKCHNKWTHLSLKHLIICKHLDPPRFYFDSVLRGLHVTCQSQVDLCQNLKPYSVDLFAFERENSVERLTVHRCTRVRFQRVEVADALWRVLLAPPPNYPSRYQAGELFGPLAQNGVSPQVLQKFP